MDISPEAWTPSPKQAEFLCCPSYEVLYGGAAGGGKSDAMLIDALGLNQKWGPAITHPRYLAGLFRPTYSELAEFINRSKQLYPDIVPGSEYYESAREWRFPSGARIKFGYLKDDSDKYQYKSAEFQYVGFEELTQFPTEDGYRYIISRVRGVPELQKYVRATTNPDGPGHEWVKRRWQIAGDGGPTRFQFRAGNELRWREFIPAKVQDNPHIDPGYVNTLNMMSEQERRALLEGRWDVPDVKGSILKPQMTAAFAQNRVCSLPVETSVPVNCFWDLGNGDGCGIWFHQRVGQQNRFIEYYEAEGMPLEHYAQVIKSRGYLVEMHYLPHDATHRTLGLGDNQSILHLFHKLGLQPTRVVPRIESIASGIEMMRQALASCWFDRERCSAGVRALANYQFKYDPNTGAYSTKPLHNWASRGADAFRQFAQGYRASVAGPAFELPQPGSRAYRSNVHRGLGDPRNPPTDWMV